MITNWNQIEKRAKLFASNWEIIHNSSIEPTDFINDFFEIYGVSKTRVLSFEKELITTTDQILLWKGVILFRTTLEKSFDQILLTSKNKIINLNQNEIPRYIVISNFNTFLIYNTTNQYLFEISISDLHQHVKALKVLLGYPEVDNISIDKIDPKAVNLIEILFDNFIKIGIDIQTAQKLILHLTYCYIAEDTAIFYKQQFQNFIETQCEKDGSNLAEKLIELFGTISIPKEERDKTIDDALNEFPYVNLALFENKLELSKPFNYKIYQLLLDCCYIDWSAIAPSLFGFMLQSRISPTKKNNTIAFHANEIKILQLINPLFMDDLRAEFEIIKTNFIELNKFHEKICSLKFLDPSCGFGNFIAIAYREIRKLEIEVIQILNSIPTNEKIGSLVSKNQFYGIEKDLFSSIIAELTIAIMEQQINLQFNLEFGFNITKKELKSQKTIFNLDPLEIDWNDLIPRNELSYIFSNPPLIGSKVMTLKQRNCVAKSFNNIKGAGVLDYVTGWFINAAKYIQNTPIKVAFVSTNSIVQGEQIGILWEQMIHLYNIKIHFAYKNLNWFSQPNGSTNYCVIIGFSNVETIKKRLLEYHVSKEITNETIVTNINPYLIAANNIMLNKKNYPICDVPEISFGNMPLDGGHLLLSDKEKSDLIESHPDSNKYIKPIISAHEFINGKKRWCLWLVNTSESDLNKFPEIQKRVNLVREFRLKSKRFQTNSKANNPSLFSEMRDFGENFIVIPKVTSERRKYIPLGYFDKNHIVSDTCISIPNGNLYHFGILTSDIHMTWVKTVCGRLKNDFRYSKEIVYNNFPWPENPCQELMERIELGARKILDIRNHYSNNSLADLYSHNMPTDLAKAHKELDEIVEKAYCQNSLPDEEAKIEFLFNLYEKYNNSVSSTLKNKPRKRVAFGAIKPTKVSQ